MDIPNERRANGDRAHASDRIRITQGSSTDKSSLTILSIEELASLIARKKISPVEVLTAVLRRVDQLNPTLNAYITLFPEDSMRQAAKAEREIMAGRYRGALHGVPIGIKDNIWTSGIRTAAGSRILSEFVPQSDATVVHKLRNAGAVLVGKTNMSEFASGATNENEFFGPTRNPWDTTRITGGSSGGSSAAVAACMSFAALGTDTGGSIRIPAALCGIVGMKPTAGRVSRHGVVPLSATFDHVGALTRWVSDAAIVLSAISGYDRLDPLSARNEVPNFLIGLRRPLHKPSLGWPREYFLERLDERVKMAIEAAATTFQGLGGVVKEVSLPHVTEATDVAIKMEYAEAARFHEASGFLPSRANEYGKRLRSRLEAGARMSAVEYLRGQELRNIVRAEFEGAFREVDAILTPTVPVPATLLGQSTVTVNSHREPLRSALIRMLPAANFTGLPAISVPCGYTPEGLPIGMQLIGRAFEEKTLFHLAYSYEQITKWQRLPPLCDD
jgi:aspartyl-tRNA(Asn)/glutamyl-tRNA(Gln) amidotransferase subunit A